MYPIKFLPIKKEMIWGSESWEISCRPNEMSIVENGEFAGQSFADVIAKDPAGVLGLDFAESNFPLLVKIIHARDALSVQVHPNDAYAKMKGGSDTGKSEMWYILQPPTDGFLIVGLKDGVTREILARAYEDGTVEQQLNRVKVKRGDVVEIPAGLIHALTPGTVVAEVQQNSDITYRLYDFGRLGADGKPRELHVQDALAVTDFRGEPKPLTHFSAQKQVVSAPIESCSNARHFSIFTAVENAAIFESASFSVSVPETSSVFIPAALGSFTIRPKNETVTLLSTHAYDLGRT